MKKRERKIMRWLDEKVAEKRRREAEQKAFWDRIWGDPDIEWHDFRLLWREGINSTWRPSCTPCHTGVSGRCRTLTILSNGHLQFENQGCWKDHWGICDYCGQVDEHGQEQGWTVNTGRGLQE